MAVDKAITDLPVAVDIGDNDLLILGQGGVAKSVLGSVLKEFAQSLVVDNDLSTTSANPVQNKAITNAIIRKPSSAVTGDFLVYDGTDWVAQTMTAWQGGSY